MDANGLTRIYKSRIGAENVIRPPMLNGRKALIVLEYMRENACEILPIIQFSYIFQYFSVFPYFRLPTALNIHIFLGGSRAIVPVGC